LRTDGLATGECLLQVSQPTIGVSIAIEGLTLKLTDFIALLFYQSPQRLHFCLQIAVLLQQQQHGIVAAPGSLPQRPCTVAEKAKQEH
jgi:hypothetical protein